MSPPPSCPIVMLPLIDFYKVTIYTNGTQTNGAKAPAHDPYHLLDPHLLRILLSSISTNREDLGGIMCC